jgi:hypothetical protein
LISLIKILSSGVKIDDKNLIYHKDNTMGLCPCGKKYAVYGTEYRKAIHCRNCQLSNEVNVINPRCEHLDCRIQCYFGDPLTKIAKYCAKHKQDGDINLRPTKCNFETCQKQRYFGDPITRVSKFCRQHKDDGDIDLRKKTCHGKDCSTNPSFGSPIDGIVKYCYKHKDDNDINLTNKKCESENCGKRPSFGNRIEGIIRYCSLHKQYGDINLVTKPCEYENCETLPAYGDEIERTARFCVLHKRNDDIHLKTKFCEMVGCRIRAGFGNSNDNIAKYCAKHRNNDDSNLLIIKCNRYNCNSCASYGFPQEKLSRCAKHKLKSQITYSRRKCVTSKCDQFAIWGYNEHEYCDLHKKDDHLNFTENNCIKCDRSEILDRDNLCYICSPRETKYIPLTKQNNLRDYLLSVNLEPTQIDKIINNGECGKQRPDFLFELPNKVIIVECDENQHVSQKECDRIRMKNVSQQFDGRPVIFIRFNPDKYQGGSTSTNIRYKELDILIKTNMMEEVNSHLIAPHSLLCQTKMYYNGWKTLADLTYEILIPYE